MLRQSRRNAAHAGVVAACAVMVVTCCAAFYLPGVAPINFEDGAIVEVLANKLESKSEHLSYDYHSAIFCKPLDEDTGEEHKGKVKSKNHLNFGQLMTGERAEATRYELNMMVDEKCKLACVSEVNPKLIKKAKKLIKKGFMVRLNADNMPVITRSSSSDQYWLGFPVGIMMGEDPVLFNHVSFTILVHRPARSVISKLDGPLPDSVHRVVGFEATVRSIDHQGESGKVSCGDGPQLVLKDSTKKVTFTYDVSFKESDQLWATRWDPLLKASPDQRRVQWIAIINSCLIAFIITLLCAVVLMRTVYLDFARYSGVADEEDISVESGWKLLHGDVFRIPVLFEVLCVLVGSGTQLVVVTGATIIFALLGLVSPASRGSLLSITLFFWTLSSFICGLSSSKLYMSVGGVNKRTVSIWSALFLSGVIAVQFLFLNLVLRFLRSSSAVPVFSLILLIFVWFGVSVPLNLAGSYVGLSRASTEMPCKTHTVPREIPDANKLVDLGYALLPGSALFAVVLVQLTFILNSLWSGSFFYMFGFLFIVFVLLAFSSMSIGMIVTYFRLVQLNYHWWWMAFLSSASSGLYLLMYCCVFYLRSRGYQLGESGGVVSVLIYFSYTGLASLCFGLVSGALSFHAAFWFAQKMFGAIRVM
mmetsp:Transcript_15769/g.34127  ORF Transcript_15769/g.34127 Transcript_15769/m.34127 type:complete len:646 (-) Transcript_15769:1449-3386(-)